MAHYHHFKFCTKGSSDFQINCTSPGTVLQALQTSHKFTELVNNKAFFIEREDRLIGIIAEHFPCHLINKEEKLTIHTFKQDTEDKYVKDESQDKPKAAGGKIVIFSVAAKGGQNTKGKQIVRNTKLKGFQFLCVYAYSEDTIATALKRDGRFADLVFQDGCKLHDCNSSTTIEINQNVEALDKHSFEISLPIVKREKGKQKPSVKVESSQGGSNESETGSTVGDSQSECEKESRMKKSEETHKQETKHKKSNNMPDFGEIYKILRSQFPDLVKHMEKRHPDHQKYQKLRKEEFVRRTRPFSTMHQVEKLVKLGTSVCRVKTATMQGTGFLLFDQFILTNAHVIEESYNRYSKKLTSPVSVNFNLGSGKSLDKEFPLTSEVFACLKGADKGARYVDFALLKLEGTNEEISELPRLIREYTSSQHANGICIIGHPGADVKSLNVSCILPHSETASADGGSSILVSFSFLPDHMTSECKVEGTSIATYNTYFLQGSSGSPVFDDDCKLIAMHTGGFHTDKIQEHSYGFGIPLQSIIWNIMDQLASGASLDAMFRFIETAAANPHLEENLKECANELMKTASDRNAKIFAKILAKIYLETEKNEMQNLSQRFLEVINKKKKHPFVQQIIQEITVLKKEDDPPSPEEPEMMECSS